MAVRSVTLWTFGALISSLGLLALASFGLSGIAQATIIAPDSIGTRWVEGKWFIEHRVEKQETFYSIARKYQIAPGILMEINPRHGNALREGEVILVPKVGSVQTGSGSVAVSPRKDAARTGSSSRESEILSATPGSAQSMEQSVAHPATNVLVPASGWVRVLDQPHSGINPFTACSDQAAPGTLIWVAHPLTGKKELFKVLGPPPAEALDPGTYLYIYPSGARSLGAKTPFFTGQFQKAGSGK